MATSGGKLADHHAILVSGKMRKLNGKELLATAPGYVADDITIADCKEFNRKADAFFEKRNQATGNWMSRSKRALQHKSAMAAVNRRKKCRE